MKTFLSGLGISFGVVAAFAAVVAVTVMFGGATVHHAVIGPQTVVAGELVVMTAEDLEGKEAVSYAWTVVPDTVQIREMENKKVLVAVFDSPGKYSVILATASGGSVTQSVHHVQVTGEVPTPQPEPDTDDPLPPPDPKPDTSEWSAWVFDLAVKTVSDPKRNVQAGLLAGQFRNVATMIAAGAITSPKAAREEIRSGNVLLLGGDVVNWNEFSQKLAGHMAGLTVDGELKTLKQYQAVYLGIAEGLDRVASQKATEKSKRWTCSGGMCRYE